jgi:hypothetical protein
MTGSVLQDRPDSGAQGAILRQLPGQLALLVLLWTGSLFLEQPLRAWCVRRALDPELLDYLPYAIHRCQWLLIAGFLVVMLYLYVVRPRLAGPGRALPLGCALALAALVHAVTLTRALQFPIAGDDSYIDYRHVVNLAVRGNLDYNVGERVMGFTSHLHYLMLAALSRGLHSTAIVEIAQNLNTVAQWGVCIALFEVVAFSVGAGINAGLASALAYVLSFYNINDAIFGKEVSLVQLAMVWNLAALHRKRWHQVAWSGCALWMLRPEGFFAAAAIGLFTLARLRSRALLFWTIPVLLCLGWEGILLRHFGTILPHGMLAKKVIFNAVPVWASARWLIGECFGNLGLSLFFPYLPQLLFLFLLLVAAWRLHPVIRHYCIGFLLLFGFFSVSNPAMMFPWYYAWFSLLVPLVLVPVLFHAANRIASLGSQWVRFLPLAGILYVVGAQLHYFARLGVVPVPVLYWDASYERLILLRKGVAELERRGLGGRDVLAVAEAGIVGYSYKGPILDLWGLVSDGVLKFYPAPPSERKPTNACSIPIAIVRSFKPDAIVMVDGLAPALLKSDFVRTNYDRVAFYPLEIWGGDGIVAYRLRK